MQDPGVRTWRQRRLLGLVLLLIALLLAWARWYDHRSVAADERTRLAVQARAVDRNLSRQIEGAWRALQGLRNDLATWPEAERVARANVRMDVLGNAMLGVRTLQWLDASGRVQASNRRELLEGPGFADRAYFTGPRQRPDAAVLFVAPPFRTVLGLYALVLSVPLLQADGAFAGVLTLTLDPSYFDTVLGSVLYAPDMWAGVVHGDGLVVVRNPLREGAPGTNLARPGSVFSRHMESGQDGSIHQGQNFSDGDPRLMAVQTVRPDKLLMDKLLVVFVSRNLDAVFAPWRRETAIETAVFAAAAAVSWLLLLAAQRRRVQSELAERDRQALQAVEAERLALALRGGDLGLWDLDLRSGVGTVNERWWSMIGKVPGAVEPDVAGWQSLVHPDDRAAALAAQNAHLAGQTPAYESTYRLRHQDGHWLWVLDRGRVVERDAAGVALRMVGTHLDISERMHAEEALRRNEESLAITLQSIGDAVIATDTKGQVTRINHAARRLTGWPDDEAIGRPLGDVFRVLDSANREPVADPVARVLADGSTVALANGTLLLARDGTEHMVADSAAPIRDAQGAVVGVVLVFSDVTAHYRMVNALREREAQLSSVADALPGPLARVDRDGRYLFANGAYERWFGIKPADMLGQTRRQVLTDEAYRPLLPQLDQALAGVTSTAEISVDTLSGRRHTMVTCVPDHDAQGAVVGAVIATVDITERRLAEEALQLSEQKSRTLFDALQSGVVMHGADSAVTDANPAACLMLGQTVAQLRGRTAADEAWCFLEEDGSPMALARYPVKQVLADGGVLRDFVVGVLRPGVPKPTWLLCNAFPLHAPGGALQEVVVTLLDFTERKLAEQDLRSSEAKLRLAGRLARLGDWRLDLASGRLRLPAEIKGIAPQSDDEPQALDVALQRIVLAHRSRLRQCIEACAQHRQPFDEEIDLRADDGSVIHMRLIGEAVSDESGKVVAVQGALQDVTEQRLAEATVRAAQQELAATLAAVPDLLFDIDLDGRILAQQSPRRDLLIMPAEAQVGRTVEQVLPGPAAAVVMQGLHEAHARGFSTGLEYELALPQGPRWFEISVARKTVAAGEKARFIVLARDITERKQGEGERRVLERQLREAQKMESIGTLAGGIAHDFNNILAAILGNVELARGDLAPGHAAAESLAQIHRAGLRARSLVQQILTFSRRQPAELRVQALRPVVDETLSMLRATLPAGVRLDARLSDEALPVDADATQVQQVLMNLCTNAWHALPEGRGHIEVGLQRVQAAVAAGLDDMPLGPCAHLWVRDDGVGMDAACQARIFEPFFTTKPVGQGTGLGLSVVLGIVRGHHGHIVVDSTPALGSTFHVYLPLADEAEAAHAATPARAGIGARQGGRVLYVDDDEVMRLVAQRLLQRGGYHVTTCDDALQALAWVQADPTRFDAVVTDFNMPDVSGLELAGQLARVRPGLPVLITSGYITDDLRQQAAQAGVAAVLRKENAFDELVGLLDQVLATAGAGKPQGGPTGS